MYIATKVSGSVGVEELQLVRLRPLTEPIPHVVGHSRVALQIFERRVDEGAANVGFPVTNPIRFCTSGGGLCGASVGTRRAVFRLGLLLRSERVVVHHCDGVSAAALFQGVDTPRQLPAVLGVPDDVGDDRLAGDIDGEAVFLLVYVRHSWANDVPTDSRTTTPNETICLMPVSSLCLRNPWAAARSRPSPGRFRPMP